MSLVLQSPSTVIMLKVSSVTSRSSCSRCRGSIAASVVRKASIVAIRGWIIPEPFAAPAMRTGRPSTVTATSAALVQVSVVKIDRQKGPCPSFPTSFTNRSNPSAIRSIGRNSPITPVEATATWYSEAPINPAALRRVSRASSNPLCPVQALA